ncbi:TetR/AcrR family transcriptional regulator [Solimonas fluminis]|uniref:TetR/AcrR family transcriptional regulator n=1 Tax=Solimonas fluminis TaxID=2086571 RepID=A0A2S5T9Y6_9GAMM|nr:TetR/AcrR family transcriptional regulator [Solimonas fluminis]PPE71811.1 TetR/AcrR family transcriptional regulator [Solimonas fluminis]
MLDQTRPGPRTKTQRRPQDPARTRAAILEAASSLLAKDGPEGLSVSQVAQLAGVNRGTAYQHFQTREQLLEATTAWVSENLRRAVFGDGSSVHAVAPSDPQWVVERMAGFAMENPELGRAWLFEVLSSSQPASDPFWHHYKTLFEKFARSDRAQPGIDTEVHSVIMLIGTFLWPVFVRSRARTARERQELVQRFTNEMLRLSLSGTMRPEEFPELQAKMPQVAAAKKPRR